MATAPAPDDYFAQAQQQGGAAGQQQQQPDPQAEKEKRERNEEMRRGILARILDGEARERLNRIHIVKPDKGRAIEDLLIRMAQGGQINGKVDEKTLIGFLNQINENQQVESKIKIQRSKRLDESDSDEDYFAGK